MDLQFIFIYHYKSRTVVVVLGLLGLADIFSRVFKRLGQEMTVANNLLPITATTTLANK